MNTVVLYGGFYSVLWLWIFFVVVMSIKLHPKVKGKQHTFSLVGNIWYITKRKKPQLLSLLLEFIWMINQSTRLLLSCLGELVALNISADNSNKIHYIFGTVKDQMHFICKRKEIKWKIRFNCCHVVQLCYSLASEVKPTNTSNMLQD